MCLKIWGKCFLLHKNGYTFPKLFLAKFSFLESPWPIEKSNPLPFLEKSLCTKPQKSSVVTTSPRGASRTMWGIAAKRQYRKKKLKFWRRGRAATGAHLAQLKPSTRPFKRASVRFSGTLSCEYFYIQKFLFEFCENLQKHPGQLGLTSRKQSTFDTAKTTFFDISCCETIRLSCFRKFIGNLIFRCFTLNKLVVLWKVAY